MKKWILMLFALATHLHGQLALAAENGISLKNLNDFVVVKDDAHHSVDKVVEVYGGNKQRMVFEKKTPVKRYGLVGDGNQYINTLYRCNQNTKVECEFSINVTPTNDNVYTFGGGNGWLSAMFAFATYPTQQNYMYGNGVDYVNSIIILGQRISVSMENGLITRDSSVVGTRVVNNFQSWHNLLIFANNDGGDISRSLSCTFYEFRVFENGILVRDFIPVPAGSTTFSTTPAPSNCMWDTVTEQYFENQGTGSFGIVEAE